MTSTTFRQTAASALAACIVLYTSLAGAGTRTTQELAWKFEYDSGNRITKFTDPAGRDTRIHYSFDEARRLRKIVRTTADGAKVESVFDETGHLTHIKDGAGVVSHGYDDLGRLNRVQRQGGPAIEYTHDTLDRITRIQIGNFYRVEYSYDFLGRLESMQTPAGKIEYEYLAGQGEVIRRLPNGVWTVWTYEPNGELRQIRHGKASNVSEKAYSLSPIADFTYKYRPDGLIEAIGQGSRLGQFSAVRSYKYDTVGRLVKAVEPTGQHYSYEYDHLGNRLKVGSAGHTPQVCTCDWAGRITTVDGKPCSYDAAGNLISVTLGGVAMTYSYNGDGQLAECAGGRVSYRYDGGGRLIARKAGETETTFIPDPLSPNWQPLVMMSKDGSRTLVVWEGANPLILIRDGGPEFLLHDQLGSVRLVLDAKGNETRRIDYEPFGTIMNAQTEMEFAPRFAGLFWDAEAQVYLTLARRYSPHLGRFMQPDPQCRIPYGSQKDLSIYSYCGADPVNFVDRDGASPTQAAWAQKIWVPSTYAFGAFPSFLALSVSSSWQNLRTSPIGREKWDWPLNFIGRAFNLNWCGRNVTGGQRYAYGLDDRNQFPLGDTTIPGRNAFDQACRKHDIQYYINTHFDKGTWVQTPGPKGNEYFRSLGGGVSSAWWTTLIVARDIIVSRGTMAHHSGLTSLPPGQTAVSLRGDSAKFNNLSKPGLPAPTNVGGVYLGGSGQLLDGIGWLEGISMGSNNNLVLISRDGGEIKLPPLRLDDLVTVFRSVYLYGEGPTVTIDPSAENPEGSAMIIRHGEATDGTYVGWILYHADRLMKGYNLGTDNLTTHPVESAVPGYPEVLDAIYFGGGQHGSVQDGGRWERFWIVPATTWRFAPARNELTLFDVPLKLSTQPMKWQNGKLVDDPTRSPSTGAAAFTKWFTANYEGIAGEQFLMPPPESGLTKPVPVFTELQRIALLTAIAERLRDQGVPMPFWMRDYEVRPVAIERITPALQITRRNERMTARIFGGVSLSPANRDVKTFNQAADLTKLPPGQQAAARGTMDRSASLARIMRREMTAADPLQIRKITHQGTVYGALALPGAETQALAPCRLEETDLVVPTGGVGEIRLVRSYNSFFHPNGPWGKGWALDLPRLAESRVPVDRDGQGRVKYRSAYELITPLNSVYARFSRVAAVPELNGGQLLIPDSPGPFFGLADAQPDFLTIPTQKLLRKDGEVWHFSKAGDLVAKERNGFRTVFERHADGRVKRIVGARGRRLVASIQLTYDSAGRLREATGQRETVKTLGKQNKTTVNYEYDSVGRLIAVRSSQGRTGYRYDGPGLVAVTHRGQEKNAGRKPDEVTVRRFEYNPRGQLLAEVDADGARTEYRVTSGSKGSTLTVSKAGGDAKTDSVRYDAAFRPVEVRHADGSKASWSYPEKGGATMVWAQAGGETVRISESPDQRRWTVETTGQRKVAGEYDTAGRLTSLSENGRMMLQQEWLSDGQLRLASSETCAVHPEYDKDGLLITLLLTPLGEKGPFERFQQTKLDFWGRPRQITDHSGLDMLMDYDESGGLKAMVSKRDGKNYGFQLTRDKEGRIQAVESSWGRQRFSYDPDGFLNKFEVTRGNARSTAEWESGRLVRARQFGGDEIKLIYGDTGVAREKIQQITAPNGLALDYRYDESGHLREVAMGDISALRMAYDVSGRLTSWGYSPGRPQAQGH